MSPSEILSIIVTVIGVFSFATIFTILYKSYANSQIAELNSGKKDIELIDEVIYEKQEKVRRRRKITGTIRTVVFYAIMVVLIPLFIFSLINRFQNNVTMIGNRTVMVVASNSMSYKNEANSYLFDDSLGLNNQFNTYDLIILEKVNNETDLKKYDVIAFRNSKGSNTIHRIIDIDYSSTPYKYTTRGDIYDEKGTDGEKPTFDKVIGRYTGKRLGGVGMFILFLQSYAGIITVSSLIYCLLMIDRIANKMDKVQEERIKKLEEALEYENEDNLNEFIKYYYEFHDSYITNVNYDISKSEIELLINVCWSGEPILKDNNAYQTNKTKMRMILNNVEKCNNKEMFSWDYINKVFIKYIKLDNKEFICFASDEQDPVIYIVCESIKYEEIKDN